MRIFACILKLAVRFMNVEPIGYLCINTEEFQFPTSFKCIRGK